jgi:hypothetical protein
VLYYTIKRVKAFKLYDIIREGTIVFDERLQSIDVTSMLDESFQQKISPEIGSTKRYPISGTQVLINHVTFENFKKTLQAGSLYFRKYSTYSKMDEIEYKKYNDLYMKYLLESERDEYNRINEVISKSVYILPMYDNDADSNLHIKGYATKSKKSAGDIDKIGLAVYYNWKRLFAHLTKYAWTKPLMDSFDETPIVYLRPCDRIFCGGIQYLDDSYLNDIAFDPADAMVPFFIKKKPI